MQALIRMEKIRKVYENGFLANDEIDFSLSSGEIHAIAGENGAGKSTLMKVLYGLERPNSGKIFLRDEPLVLRSPADALRHGIGMVHQHFMLVDELTVTENLFLGMELNHYGWLDKAKMLEQAKALGTKYHMELDYAAKCKNLSVSQKQKVEILKVLLRAAEIIIFDEPTAVLTAIESAELFEQLRLLRDDHHTIVIITHKLQEIKDLCDRVTVLRQGKNLGTFKVSEISKEEISRLMVGFDIPAQSATQGTQGETVLGISHLTCLSKGGKKALSDVSLSVHAGEIVCLAGVEGNGQDTTVDCLVGWRSDYQGTIALKGTSLQGKTIRAIRSLGIGHIPADRMTLGANVNSSIFDNLIALDVLDTPKRRLGFIERRKLIKSANTRVDTYRIATDGIHKGLKLLSGGNIQKVVVARELDRQPSLLIANQPTRGIDVGAIEFIYDEMRRLRASGGAIILISSDWNEIFTLANRILVFHDGKIVAHIEDLSKIDERVLGRYMLGLETMTAEGGVPSEK